MIITFEHTYFYRSKECNIPINNCRTRDQTSADANIHNLLSGRKWRFGVIRSGALNISYLPLEIMQSIHLTTWCNSFPTIIYAVIAATSAKCLIFITASYLNTPQACSGFHYKNTVLQHCLVCDKNCSPPPILLGTIQMDTIYIYIYLATPAFIVLFCCKIYSLVLEWKGIYKISV